MIYFLIPLIIGSLWFKELKKEQARVKAQIEIPRKQVIRVNENNTIHQVRPGRPVPAGDLVQDQEAKTSNTRRKQR